MSASGEVIAYAAMHGFRVHGLAGGCEVLRKDVGGCYWLLTHPEDPSMPEKLNEPVALTLYRATDDEDPELMCVTVKNALEAFLLVGDWFMLALANPEAFESKKHEPALPPAWPLEIAGIEALRVLVAALVNEGRTFHFDDDPAELAEKVFSEAEIAHLKKLLADCERFGGVWMMMQNEPEQICHRLLGIAGEEVKP